MPGTRRSVRCFCRVTLRGMWRAPISKRPSVPSNASQPAPVDPDTIHCVACSGSGHSTPLQPDSVGQRSVRSGSVRQGPSVVMSVIRAGGGGPPRPAHTRRAPPESLYAALYAPRAAVSSTGGTLSERAMLKPASDPGRFKWGEAEANPRDLCGEARVSARDERAWSAGYGARLTTTILSYGSCSSDHGAF